MKRRSRVFALISLSLGGFGIGATEFAIMGLVPEITQDLLPELYASAPEEALGRVGIMISAYALGVVIGAPTLAVWLARYPRRGVLVGLSLAFTVLTLLTVVSPTFEIATLSRLLAGLPHGAYFGIASLAAADMMEPGQRGRGVAAVLLGLSVSNVVGVPLITALGHALGWRYAFLIVAALFACATVAIALTVPHFPALRGATILRELGALRNGRVWLGVGIGAIGFGGFFAAYSYVAPIATELTGMPASAVPWLLATIGIGMTIGNMLGGRLADRGVLRTLGGIMPAFVAVFVILALTAQHPVMFVIGLFLLGLVGATMVPSVQVRLMDVSGKAQTLGAALMHSAMNIGNSMGAALAAAVIAAGLGFRAPFWVGVILSFLGMLLVYASRIADRSAAARSAA